MAIKTVKYKEPKGYFTPEMLKAAEDWEKAHEKSTKTVNRSTKTSTKTKKK